MPTKCACPHNTLRAMFLAACGFLFWQPVLNASAQEASVEAAETGKETEPALIDVTTQNKTLFSIIDAGPPKIDETETVSPETAYSAFQRGWFLTALALATPLAEQGDKAAQALLGVLHEKGPWHHTGQVQGG